MVVKLRMFAHWSGILIDVIQSETEMKILENNEITIDLMICLLKAMCTIGKINTGQTININNPLIISRMSKIFCLQGRIFSLSDK